MPVHRQILRVVAGAFSLAALALLPACRTAAPSFLWVDQVPKTLARSEASPAIQPGDVISVRVWNLESNSVDRARVREDGKISMPFLQDVDVAGEEPSVVAKRLEDRLKAFINTPVVTVVVHERRPLRVSVLGKVVRAGVYDLDPGSGVLQGLAAAGGLTPFADDNGIYVIRSGYWADTQAPVRIRFRYRDLASGAVPAATFQLRLSDVVVVE